MTADRPEAGEVIQIVPFPTHRWGGCLAVVDEDKGWGVMAYVPIPANDGMPPGKAYIRLADADFERLGVKLKRQESGDGSGVSAKA